ncbi:MAG: leucine-rich repeat domain-containing protein, partial [Candidatus Azobacteroides sp.]|nr:leucine-rich repeat domain-containing protein [Candidatus Azobacteroides sp.]
MKKTFLFLAALCFCAFVNKAVGQTWSLNNGTLVISGDDAFSTDPYPWAGRTGEITKLSIGSGVTSIPGSAFSDCTGLTDVTLEDGTTALSFNGSSDQFSNCPIKTFYWGRNLVQYGSPCSNKATLTLVTFGANVSSIGDNDFSNCTGLTSVTIPSSIISIGDWAFYYCSSLKSITFPGSIASIGYSAFQYSGLTSVSIPNNITSIYSSAFADCTGLTDVTLEDGATVLSFNGSDQFSNCP